MISYRPDVNSSKIHCTSPGYCPDLSGVCCYSIDMNSIQSKRLLLHKQIFEKKNTSSIILDCLGEYSLALLYKQRSVDLRVVAESIIVTGTICFISNSDHWIDDLLAKVEDNYHVFMIEGYGMILLANSLIMAMDELEILEASCQSYLSCIQNNIPIVAMSEELTAKLQALIHNK